MNIECIFLDFSVKIIGSGHASHLKEEHSPPIGEQSLDQLDSVTESDKEDVSDPETPNQAFLGKLKRTMGP